MRAWTKEEISTLIGMWPKASVMQIANTLHRSPGSIRDKAQRLRDKGMLEANVPQSGSIKPDRQDFDEVKMDYCRKNHITTAELYSRFESDDQLAAELYRQAQAAKLTRLRPRKDEGLWEKYR